MNRGCVKGIILAGGSGSRLYPSTAVISKQLQTIYDKPMIYYPLATLMIAGIRDIAIIVSPSDRERFEALLGSGDQWGVQLTYVVQQKPEGIAQAFHIVPENFLDGCPVALILGDNIFHGKMGLRDLVQKYRDGIQKGATIFSYPVSDPERYGIVNVAEDGSVISLEEKPKAPKSKLAIPGIYMYDSAVRWKAASLVPSARGEYEITDLNKAYLAEGELEVQHLGRGIAWLDTGTPESMLEASNYIAAIENRQGLKIACLEEVAYECGYVDMQQLKLVIGNMPKSSYREYLQGRYEGT